MAMAARPFLKWAGGKRQLLPALRQFYPTHFECYHEPFLGSGAVFFDLHARGLLDGRAAILTDTNRDLIGCYHMVRDATDEVIRELSALSAAHARSNGTHYYEVRDKRFNIQRRDRVEYTPALAAMFIYLNRTGYNGLFRLNAKGAFNVPAGRYDNPKICDADNLRRVAAALQNPKITVRCQPFDSVLADAHAGDFIYLDPPYAPLSPTAKFTSYTAHGFSLADQARLRKLMIALTGRGCHVVLSNSTAREIENLYEADRDVALAGLRSNTVPARRAINSNAQRRGSVTEYIISNVEPSTETRN